MIYRLTAIDPGLRSGCVIVEFDPEVRLLVAEDVPGGVDGLIGWLENNRKQVLSCQLIVVEDFITREGIKGVRDYSSRGIGAVKQFASQYDIPVSLQLPGGRLKRVPDWVLVKLFGDVFRGNAQRNVREAVRHAVSYAKSNGNRAVLGAFRNDETPQP